MTRLRNPVLSDLVQLGFSLDKNGRCWNTLGGKIDVEFSSPRNERFTKTTKDSESWILLLALGPHSRLSQAPMTLGKLADLRSQRGFPTKHHSWLPAEHIPEATHT